MQPQFPPHPQLQPQLQLQPLLLHPHPQPHPQDPFQPQLFPPQLFPPHPQQQNRMMIRTIHKQPLSFPLLKHIVSHLSLDPGPPREAGGPLDLSYSMLPRSAGSLTP